MSKIRILIIDGHPNVRKALAARLAASGEIEVMGTARNAIDGLRITATERPDVVLLGLRTQSDDRDPSEIATLASETKSYGGHFLVLTTYAVDDERHAVLSAGAERYLLKDIDTRRLIGEIVEVVQTPSVV